MTGCQPRGMLNDNKLCMYEMACMRLAGAGLGGLQTYVCIHVCGGQRPIQVSPYTCVTSALPAEPFPDHIARYF